MKVLVTSKVSFRTPAAPWSCISKLQQLKVLTKEETFKTTLTNLFPRVRITLDQRSGTPVIGQTAQASGIRTSGFTKWRHYSTRQLSFP